MAAFRWRPIRDERRIVDDGTGEELERAFREMYDAGCVGMVADRERGSDRLWHLTGVRLVREKGRK